MILYLAEKKKRKDKGALCWIEIPNDPTNFEKTNMNQYFQSYIPHQSFPNLATSNDPQTSCSAMNQAKNEDGS